MPFETVKTVSGNEKRVLASLSFKRVKTKNGGAGISPRLVVGIPAAIADGIRIRPGQRFVFALGTGDDAGKARIMPSANGIGVEARMIKGGVTFLFGLAPELGDEEEAKQYCKAEAFDGGFEIDVPEWLKQLS